MPIYRLNGKTYNVPDNVVNDFERDNPSATVSYSVGKTNFEIPVRKREGFLKKYPNAVQGRAKKEVDGGAPTNVFKDAQLDSLGREIDKANGAEPMEAPTRATAAEAPVAQQSPEEVRHETAQRLFNAGPERKITTPRLGLDTGHSGRGIGLQLSTKPEIGLTGQVPIEASGEQKTGNKELPAFGAAHGGELGAQALTRTMSKAQDAKRMRELMGDDYGDYEAVTKALNAGREDAVNPNMTLEQAFAARGELDSRIDALERPTGTGLYQASHGVVDTSNREELEYLKHQRELAQELIDNLIDKEYKDRSLTRGGTTLLSNPLAYESSMYAPYDIPTEQVNMEAQRRQVAERISLLDEASRKDSGFWRGARDGFDTNALTFGLSGLADSRAIREAQQRYEKGEASESDIKLLEDAVTTSQAHATHDDELGAMYGFGKIASQALPFVGEFMLTGGYSGLSTAGKALGRLGSMRYGKNALSKWLIRALGTTAGDVASAGAMAMTTGAPKTVTDIMERHLGTLAKDDNGDYVYGHYEDRPGGRVFVRGGERLGKAIYEGMVNNTLEYYTEMLGGHMEKPLGSVGKWAADKLGLSAVSNALSKISTDSYSRIVRDALSRGGIQDVPVEVLEEEANLMLNGIFVGDNNFSLAPIRALWDESVDKGSDEYRQSVFNPKTQRDITLGMFFSVGYMNAMPVTAGTAHNAYGYYKTKNDLDGADKVAGFRLTQDKWEPLKERIDETSNDKLEALLGEILDDGGLYAQEKRAVADYIKNLVKFRGYNTGLAADARNTIEQATGAQTPEEAQGVAETSAENAAFMQGTQVPEEEYYNMAQNYLQAEQSLTPEQLALAQQREGMSDGEWQRVMNGLSAQDAAAISNYLTSRARVSGALERVRAEALDAVRIPETAIGIASHDGVLNMANVNGREVFVISQSGNSAVVIDPNTLQESFVPLGKVSDMQQVNAEEYANTLRESVTQEAEANADWKLTHHPQTKPVGVGLEVPVQLESGEGKMIVTGQTEDGRWQIVPGEYDPEAGGWKPKGGDVVQMMDEHEILGMQDEYYSGQPSTEVAAQEQVDEPHQTMTETEIPTQVAPQMTEEEERAARVQRFENDDFSGASAEEASGWLFDKAQSGLNEEEAEAYIASRRAEAQNTLNRLKKKAPKVGTNIADYKRKKAEWQQKIDAAREEAQLWDEMKRRRDRETGANLISEQDLEPQTLEEIAASMLASGAKVMGNDEDVDGTRLRGVKSHTGYSNDDFRKMPFIFASREKGGMSAEKFGEAVLQEARDRGVRYDEDDANAGLNALVNVLGSVRTQGDINSYIRNNRDAQARAMMRADEEAKAAWEEEQRRQAKTQQENGQGELAFVPESGMDEAAMQEAQRESEAKDESREAIEQARGKNELPFEAPSSDELRFRDSDVREFLLEGQPVRVLTGKEFEKSDEPLTERVPRYYEEEYGGKVTREDVGTVLLDERSVRDSIAHGLGRSKAVAFAAVPEIITDGAIIDRQSDWKGRGYGSVTFAAPITINGERYIGVVVANEIKDNPDGTHRFYLHEVALQKKLLNEEFKTGMDTGSPSGDVAKVLKNILTSKESGETLTENNAPLNREGQGEQEMDSTISDLLGKSDEQRKSYTGRARENARTAGERLAERLSLPVTFVNEVTDELTEGMRPAARERAKKSKGWFDPKTGKIVVAINNHGSADDVLRTVLHEGVAHYGLRELFGEDFDTFLDNIYNNVSNDLREEIDRRTKERGWSQREATEEFLASLAEDTNFEQAMAQGWWDKIKFYFLEMLRMVGLTSFPIRDADLRYMLYRSYKNLEYRREGLSWEVRDIFTEANDVITQRKLGVRGFQRQETPEPQPTERAAESITVPGGELSVDNPPAVDILRNNADRIEGLSKSGMFNPSNDILLVKDGDIYAATPSLGGNLLSEIFGTVEPLDAVSFTGKNIDLLLARLVKLGHRVAVMDSVVDSVSEDSTVDNDVTWYGGENAVEEPRFRDDDEAVETSVGAAAFGEENGEAPTGNDVPAMEGAAATGVAREAYETAMGSTATRVKEIAQDRWKSVLEGVRAVEKESGTKVKDYENPYFAVIIADEAAKAEHEAFRKNVEKRLMTVVGKLTKTTGKSAEEVDDYAYEKHALERNRVLAFRDVLNTMREAYQSATGRSVDEVYRWYKDDPMRSANDRALLDAQRAFLNGDIMLDEYYQRYLGWERVDDMLREQCLNAAARELPEKMKAGDAYQKNRMLDYSGLEWLKDPDADSETDVKELEKRAFESAAQFEKTAQERGMDMTDFWHAIREVSDYGLRHNYESGLISKELYDYIGSMFDYYVPLRGWDSDTAEDIYTYSHGNGSFGGNMVMRAGGRRSKGDRPIATLCSLADLAITTGNRNLAKQALLRMAENHKTDLLSVSKLWYKWNDDTEEYEVVDYAKGAGVKDTDDAATVRAKYEAFEEKMRELASEDGQKYVQSGESADIPARITREHLSSHQVIVKRGGVNYVVTVNGNPRLAQAMNGELVKKGDNVLRLLGRTTSSLVTSLHPYFVLSNIVRDFGYAYEISGVRESTEYQNKMMKQLPRCAARVPGLLIRYLSGGLNMSNKMDRLFEEFMSNGGETGRTRSWSIDDFAAAQRRAERRTNGRYSRTKAADMKGAPYAILADTLDIIADVMGGYIKAVESFARWSELSSRFAAYCVSKDMGRSTTRAIYDAKEITANFDKKGSGAELMDKTKDGWKLYVFGNIVSGLQGYMPFFNAGMQGMASTLDAAYGGYDNNEGSGKKAITAAAKWTTLGALSPFIYAFAYALPKLLFGGGDDDEADKDLEKLMQKGLEEYYVHPYWDRQMNLVLGSLKAPLSPEIRGWYGPGEIMSETLWRLNTGRYVDGCDVAWRTLKAYSELLPVHPDEGFKGPLPIPLVASIEAEQNESWTGAPIYNELLFDDKYKKANWETTKAGQYPVLTGISKALNNATRGKGKRGVINFNPSKVGYVLRQSLGGLYVVPSDITETALSLMHGETPEPKHLPFVSRFYSPTGELQQQRNTASEYHKNKERWLDWNARTKEIEESGDTAEIRERKASKESKLFDEFEYWRKQIDSARRDKDKAREDSLMYWCNEALRLKEQNAKEPQESDYSR